MGLGTRETSFTEARFDLKRALHPIGRTEPPEVKIQQAAIGGMRRVEPPRGRIRGAGSNLGPRGGRSRRRRTNTRCAAPYGTGRQELFKFSLLSCGQVVNIAV